MKMLVVLAWQPLWLPSLKPKQRLQLSLITDTVDTEATVEDMEDMVVMVLGTPGATTASVRLRLSPTMATVDTVVATTASVRPMPSLRPLLSLITDTADTE